MNLKFDRKKFFDNYINRKDFKYKDFFINYFEFGIFEGSSFILFYKELKNSPFFKSEKFHFYLFDSFKGMPATNDIRDKNPQWNSGDYKFSKKQLINNFNKHEVNPSHYTIIDGFFLDTLKKNKKKTYSLIKIPRCDFVYMDCDYFSSTLLALNFIKKLMHNRTIIYFDNIWSFSGHPGKGELGALNRFNKNNKKLGIVPYPILSQESGRVYIAWSNDLNYLNYEK